MTRAFRSALVLAALSTAQRPDADAQASRPEPGARIRVAARGVVGARPRQLAGVLVRLAADSLVVDTEPGGTLALPTTDIEALAVSRGKHGHALAGAGVGFLVGAGVAYAVLSSGGSTSPCDETANQDAIGSTACLGLAALGGAAAAGLGAVIGGFVRTERWQDVPLERLRVGLRSQGGRLGLTVVVAF
jgi:hypothetical protein